MALHANKKTCQPAGDEEGLASICVLALQDAPNSRAAPVRFDLASQGPKYFFLPNSYQMADSCKQKQRKSTLNTESASHLFLKVNFILLTLMHVLFFHCHDSYFSINFIFNVCIFTKTVFCHVSLFLVSQNRLLLCIICDLSDTAVCFERKKTNYKPKCTSYVPQK